MATERSIEITHHRLTAQELAALLWDGMHNVYSAENLTYMVNESMDLDARAVGRLVRAMLRDHGRRSVNNGPRTATPEAEVPYTEQVEAWCTRQVTHTYKLDEQPKPN